MSIHSSSGAVSIASGMHGAIGGIGQAAILAFALSRRDADRLEAEQAAAAQGARFSVLRSTVHGLRRDLADERFQSREALLDVEADADFFRSENAKLLARVRQLEAALVRMDSDCRTLADALCQARAA